ncbi:MAG: ABC transporter substrate-binding protein [Alistipes sp.]|nr:ABC transporter substrate-binding protein [Candidatus Alistipes equi]
MKRLIRTIFFGILLLVFAYSTQAQDRKNILKIYNWADYIDEDVLANFKGWYKEQTGEDIEIIYQLFDINEIMLAKIERGHEDFDVVCPSDYIIERMLRNKLLLPIDQNFGKTPNYIKENISPYIAQCVNQMDNSGCNPNDYVAPYMWGTTGILYNTQYVKKEEASSWGVLLNEKFHGKILLKDAFRDVFCPILAYMKYEQLQKGEILLNDLMRDSSDEAIALVEKFLMQAKKHIVGWEADFGKEMMTKGNVYINMTWGGDAAWAIKEAKEVGVELDYTIPKEGSNVFFDGWVIPKYAQNVKAASYFINYMCIPQNAIKNMDAIGYVSTIASEEILKANEDPEIKEYSNVSYFFGPGHDSIRINHVQYPDISIINRCAMMHDSADRTEYMLEMWSRVKGDNMGTGKYLIIGCLVIIVCAILVFRRKNHSKSHKK